MGLSSDDVLARAETDARAKLADLRTALDSDLPAMREVFQSLFPEGLTFRPATNTPAGSGRSPGPPGSTVSNWVATPEGFEPSFVA